MDISIDSSEVSEEKMEEINQFIRDNSLEGFANEIGCNFYLPIELLDQFNWMMLKQKE